MSNQAATISTASGAAKPPGLAEGIELIGEYKGSGFEEPPYLVRRSDGQVVQLKRLLYIVAEEIDDRRDYEQIARSATERYGLKLRPDQAQVLVERLRALRRREARGRPGARSTEGGSAARAQAAHRCHP